jgi:putative oxidoreductase
MHTGWVESGLGSSGLVWLGLFVVRAVAGLLIAGHGAQKLFGWFGGYGVAGTGGFLESLGFRPGRAFAAAAGVSEFFGGLLIAGGLLGPVGPALVLATMLVVIVSVHWHNGVFAATNGVELPLLNASVAVAIALTGFGAGSLDAALGLTALWTPWVVFGVLGVGVVGGVANLAARHAAVVEG